MIVFTARVHARRGGTVPLSRGAIRGCVAAPPFTGVFGAPSARFSGCDQPGVVKHERPSSTKYMCTATALRHGVRRGRTRKDLQLQLMIIVRPPDVHHHDLA